MQRSPASRLICAAPVRNIRHGLTWKAGFLRFAGNLRNRSDGRLQQRSYAIMITFDLNDRTVSAHSPDDTPLLWVIRDELGLTGTKFGCGIGFCGACTVCGEGRATRSCITPIRAVAGAKITTIEGLDPQGKHPLQIAWLDLQVPQCGYCQSGQIMQAAALLAANKNPSRDDIVRHMDGNICRCGTYPRILRAVERAAKQGA